jgi:FdhE protein
MAKGSGSGPLSAASRQPFSDRRMNPAESGQALLTALGDEHAEWRPLLALIEQALREVERPVWAAAVPTLEHYDPGPEPLLSGAVIHIAPRLVGRWVRRVMVTAAAGAPEEPFVKAVTAGRLDPLPLFEAAVSRDVDRLHDLARVVGDDRGVLSVLAPIIAMPLLHACRRVWAARVPARWPYGYCPICGGWSSLAEIRGLDGSRHLRCRCCGGDWEAEWLRCPFCGERDHENLGSLVTPDSLERQKIEVCESCHGYLKTITTFAPVQPEHVVLQDLTTLVLDVAALEHGYHSPSARERVAVSVVAERSRLRALLRLSSRP